MSWDQLAASWWLWIWPLSLQVAFLALVVWLIERLMGRRLHPSVSGVLWGLVMIRLVLPPSLSSPWSLVRLESLARFAFSESAARAGSAPLTDPGATLGLGGLLALWLSGVAILLGAGVWRYRRQRSTLLAGAAGDDRLAPLARSIAGRLRLRGCPRVVLSPTATGPVLIGYLEPIVVLPRRLRLDARPRQLEHVLLHELSHVARRDPLRCLAVQLVQLVFWFHPAAWLLRRRLVGLRELACDRHVARLLRGSTLEYRATVLELARPLASTPAPIGLGFLARRGDLLQRLDLLAAGGLSPSIPQRLSGTAICAALLICCVPPAPTNPPPPNHAVPGLGDYELPKLGDTRGCLQLRYAVMGRLAAEQAARR